METREAEGKALLLRFCIHLLADTSDDANMHVSLLRVLPKTKFQDCSVTVWRYSKTLDPRIRRMKDKSVIVHNVLYINDNNNERCVKIGKS